MGILWNKQPRNVYDEVAREDGQCEWHVVGSDYVFRQDGHPIVVLKHVHGTDYDAQACTLEWFSGVGTLDECKDKAERYLSKHGYPHGYPLPSETKE